MFVLILLALVHISRGLQYAPELSNYILIATHSRCNETPDETHVGIDGSQSSHNADCAALCDARSTCVVFNINSITGSCELFDNMCSLTTGVDSENVIYRSRSDYIEHPYLDDFDLVLEDYRCFDNIRLDLNQGVDDLNSHEACAKYCIEYLGKNCNLFSFMDEYTTGDSTTTRCNFYHDGCRPALPNQGLKSDNNYQLYLMKGIKFRPVAGVSGSQYSPGFINTATSTRFDHGQFHYSYSNDNKCAIKAIDYNYGTASQSIHDSSLTCRIQGDAAYDGILHLSTTTYDDAMDPYETCGNLCYEWNNDTANTKECRGFSKIPQNPGFKCQLVECNIYQIVKLNELKLPYITTGEESGTRWGFLDDYETPECRGQYQDFMDSIPITNYVRDDDYICDPSTSIASRGSSVNYFSTASSGECAKICEHAKYHGISSGESWKDCVAYEIIHPVDNSNSIEDLHPKCIPWAYCDLVPNTDPLDHVIVRTRLDLGNWHLHNDSEIISTSYNENCDGGTVISSSTKTHVMACKDECDLNDSCTHFTFNNALLCTLYSDCPAQVTLLETSTFEIQIEDPPTAEPTTSPTKNPTTSPTKNPTTSPTKNPINSPTKNPTNSPTNNPITSPTNNPTTSPTKNPTAQTTFGRTSLCSQDTDCLNQGQCRNNICNCKYPFYGEFCEFSVDCGCI